MQDFFNIMSTVFSFFTMDFTVYGFTFSFWDIAIWSAVVGLAVPFLFKLLSGFGGGD